MANRTQILCLCEGGKGQSIDEVFINRLIKSLDPNWVRPTASNTIRMEPCGGRKAIIERLPQELRNCLNAGGNTTLMVWADCDDDCTDCDELRAKFWQEAQRQGITTAQFDQVVFAFAKDRLENWIEFLLTGSTNEAEEGPRVSNRKASDAAKQLAEFCKAGAPVANLPPSLQWSCANWRALRKRME